MFIAHSANDHGQTHGLKEHLLSVSNLAQSFAISDLQKEILKYAGIYHDAGKYQNDFQNYLTNGGPCGSVPHAAIGAALAHKFSPSILTACIDGHHKGLSDRVELVSSLKDALKGEAIEEVKAPFLQELVHGLAGNNILDQNVLDIYKGKDFELFTRFIFSALTDADWLDTEHHFSPHLSQARQKTLLVPSELLAILEQKFKSFSTKGEINQLRNTVRDYAASKANVPMGFFSLSLPTGMGKTLTSLYWALLHAEKHNLKRIIIVLPFVNIIDQTAKLLKDMFGEDWILEHHSGISESTQYNDETRHYNKRKLACENWDFPIIVTTTVQFFESLFSNKPSKCRKIHNIAESVVIFDEVQTLPKIHVLPILTMLKNVSNVMRTTFLFCTATQPAFKKRDHFDGIENIHPLVQNPADIFAKTVRVSYHTINDLNPIEPESLVGHVISENQSSLIIFNTKREAAQIFSLIKQSNTFEKCYHLSTSMCPAHRKKVIEEIRTDLANKINIAVCSTQLIEAGVDFDFPRVYRAVAPLESIIQSAGRCNREGKMSMLGQVFLFELENAGMPVDSAFRAGTQLAKRMLLDNLDSLHFHDSFEHYFAQVVRLYVDPDSHKIEDARDKFQFKTVAQSFRIIDNVTTPIFIRDYDDQSKDLFDRLQYKPLSRNDQRQMQPYIVQIYPNFEEKFKEFIYTTENGIVVWCGTYDKNLGIVGDVSQVDRYIV